MKVRTAGELIAELEKVDPNTPVVYAFDEQTCCSNGEVDYSTRYDVYTKELWFHSPFDRITNAYGFPFGRKSEPMEAVVIGR
ncbi:hypothetical protein SEA_CULVER_11 [Gordonia phage Culver]|nr:hypothetical protein SEA_CULVER_11 [Gordonia phage Culver]